MDRRVRDLIGHMQPGGGGAREDPFGNIFGRRGGPGAREEAKQGKY
jgi:hypothetical protein